ncbi:MAG: rod shape-determining protein MreC [bacterium]
MKQTALRYKYLYVLVVVALLIFLHQIKVLKPLETLVINMLKPGLSTGYEVSQTAEDWYEEASSDVDWQAKAKELEAANVTLTMTNAQLEYVKQENVTLRQYVNFFENSQYDWLLARVISQQADTNSNLENSKLLINKGSRHGLVNGLLVVEAPGMIIGRLTKVTKDWSEVALVTDPACRLAISLQPNSQVMGVAQGDAGLTIKLNFIPQTVNLNVNDLVVTSGLETNVPPALVLGRVSQVERDSNELWQSALVEPSAKLDNLSIVSVILPQTVTNQ